LNTFDDKISRGELWVNDQIAGEFQASLNSRVSEDQAAGKPDLRSRFDELRKIFCRIDSRPPEGATKLRTQWIGELRRLLARVCLSALKPDLIIMDEFQRFKHLLDADSEAGELARDLFDSEAGQGAKVLLLSATPYRGLSLHHEADDDHYSDFLALLGFLEDGNASGCKEVLAEYRAALPTVMTPQGQARLRNAKTALEKRLRRVMARTERLASDVQRGGMLLDAPPAAASLKAADIRAFLGAQRIADVVEQGDVMEYWKSSPYLFNFMDTYALKQAFESTEKKQDLVRLVREFPDAFLDLARARSYQALEPANARLRALLADTVDRGMSRLLWVPPTMGYYQAAGPFAAPELQKVTKRLVFSAWHMVPRAVASLVSYEAERRMMRSAQPRAQLTQEDWKKQRGLLRFGIAAERLTGLPLFLLVYPCLTFAKSCDPRELARGVPLTATEVRSCFAERIQGLVREMGIIHEPSGSIDERWYWLAPMLLDFARFPQTVQEWWERPDLSQTWAGLEASEEDAGWARHVGQALKTLSEVRSGIIRLGMPPSDLFDVLGIAASAAPATAALRTYIRATGSDPERCSPLLDIAARTGRAFLTLFNHTEVIETIHTEYPGEPYWERVLEYTHAGGLQAVLDEYAHLLKESLGVAAAPAPEIAKSISSELIAALTLRTASLYIDEVTAPRYAREVKLESEPMHVRFAMRFGDERSDEEPLPVFVGSSARTRKERVRAAFNSPFWPFVLVSTSVGQEGLDFHHYCHAVMHWNLPSNPVDLEQREGRIHRYKGHAVRKNISATHAAEAFRHPMSDVWQSVFAIGHAKRPAGENDLVPYWLFPGEAKIERHVPAIPFSREVDRLHELRRSLAIYRMVFGQSRQEDLVTYLLAKLPEDQVAAIVAELKIDLSPTNRKSRRDEDILKKIA
jgi:hypothetical protein